ncbi:Ig-like domain-containing protein [Corallococcus sp. AS-1-6]|uniref:Ig-like domain-containing protein n=1 Tax=Corallococcus sp. AS-1-6 TaxID=2874599 RepID=UPI001CBADCDC|nr:tandem-95 repeat protein [Corallococcus sp. AS-1-6]
MRAPASPPLPASFRIGCLLALSLALACTRDAPAPSATVAPPGAVPESRAPELESAPFDVGAVIRQVHFAWRPENGAWSGGHSTYTARSGAEGLTLTPYHHPRKPDTAPVPGAVTKTGDSASPLTGAPLTLGTPGLKRGAKHIGAPPARERVEQDGHLVLARGDVTEHLRNAEDGVEQSWTFEHAPSGLGDLVVEVPVKGLTYQGTTGTGLHFTDARTGLGFRYGHGTWVDGRGQRTSVEARFVEGHIQLRVPAGVLDASAYPAVLDPRISPEFGMDTPVIGRQVGDQTGPAVAANGSTWLVVWHDYSATAKQVTGTRVSSSGQVLDVNGITLPRGDKASSRLSVAAGASEWLVVWEEFSRDIHGARVGLGGQVMDPSGIPIAAIPGYQYAPAVAWSGSEYFVVWYESNGSVSAIWGTRLSSTGQPLASPVRISPSTGFANTPDVAFNGTDYLVVWQDYNSTRAFDIRGARVSSGGTLRDTTPLSLCEMDGDQLHPAVAANSGAWLVVWGDQRAASFEGDIYGTVVSSTGSVGTPNGRVLTSLLGNQSHPDVVARGYGWFVVWEDARSGYPDIYGSGVDWDGTPSYRGPVAVSAQGRAEYLPAVASSGGDLLVVWYEAHAGGYDVHGARVTTQDVVRDTASILLSTAPNDQYTPAVARTGTDYLVVWRDNRAGESDIYGVRVTSQGVVLDPSGIPLCTERGEQDNPTVASNGTDWMVAWDDNRYDATHEILYGVRVSTAGVVRSAWSIGTSSWAMLRPALASDGTDWYVVWEDGRGSLSSASWDIFGAKVTASGTVTPTYGTNLTSGNTGTQLAPDIAFNGTEYLVAWTDYRSYVTNSDDIYATRVSRTGTVNPVGGFVLSKASGRQVAPAVASAGSDWFVVWQDGRNTSQDIYGTRVSAAGTVLEPSGLAIATTSIAQRNPTVASDGVNYFVAWEEQTTSSNQDIHGAQVSGSTGALIEAPFAIAASPQNEVRPAAASHAPSRFLLLYQRTDPAVTSLAERIQARLINLNHAPVAEAQSLTTAEDEPLPLTLAVTDADGDALTFTIVTPPSHGALSGTPPALTYTPSTHFNGADSFTYRATDSSGESSAVVTVSLFITPVNDPPTGDPVSIFSDEDKELDIKLQGSDPEGEAVTFSVQVPPEHGTLTGTPPDLKYTPVADYHGTDGFTFIVTDASGATSKPTPVSITLSPMNDHPVAYAQSASLDQDTSVDLVLEGSDVDGDALTFSIPQLPAHGTLSGTAPNVRYTPAPGYRGPDSFTFRVQDDQGFPASATVSLTVRAVNVAPVAHAQSATLREDTAWPLTLAGSDADGDALTYAIVTGPAHGALSGTPPQVTYTPNANFHGSDSFTFIVRDTSGVDSSPATVDLTVTAGNDAPVAQPQAVETEEDVSLPFTLAGSDVDGDALTFTLATLPEHGTLSGTPPDVTYTPHADFHGEDGFTFQVTDSEGSSSEPARVSVTVSPVNDAPVAPSKTVPVVEDGWTDFVLEGQDVDGEAVDFTVRTQPLHGVLTGTPPDLRYTPAGDFHGEDRFTFTVSDESGAESAPATVTLAVSPVNDAPVAFAQSASVDEDTGLDLVLHGSDVEGNPLTFLITVPPGHGTLSGTPPEVTYTPAADFHGEDGFTFVIRDGAGATSQPATVSLTVRPASDAPVATAQSRETDEDTALSLTLTGTDADGQTLRFAVATQPQHGTLTGTPPDVTYTPHADFHGEDGFTFTVSDGESTSTASVSLTVRPVNDAPLALGQLLQVEPEPTALTLSGTDVDGDTITFAIHTPPEHGTLEGTPPELTFTPAEGFRGTTTFTFTASDGLATSAPATVTLRVGNSAPVVAVALQTQQPFEGEALHFQTTAADANGDALTFTWDFGDGATSEEASPSHAYANEGTYEAVLTVTDGIDTVRRSWVLEVRNAAPVLVPVEAPARTDEGEALTFRARASDSGEWDALTFMWDFGDGSAPASGPEAVHTYADSGLYTVKVTVTDDAGAFSQEVREVQVANLPPVPVPVPAQTLRGGDVVSLQLKATDAAGDRDPLTWSLVEGPGTVTPEGLYTWTTEARTGGHFPVRIVVMDDDAGSTELVLDLSVQEQLPRLPPQSTGCGCASGQGGAASSVTLLAVLALLVSRRRPPTHRRNGGA